MLQYNVLDTIYTLQPNKYVVGFLVGRFPYTVRLCLDFTLYTDCDPTELSIVVSPTHYSSTIGSSSNGNRKRS